MASTQPNDPQTDITILSGGKATVVPGAWLAGDDVWLKLADLPSATGWELKPEGVCRDEVCITMPTTTTLVEGAGDAARFNLTEFARYVGQPYAYDAAHRVWSFGPPAYEWQSGDRGGQAPNFTLPDFAGKPRSLAEFRGKKIFLLTWASW